MGKKAILSVFIPLAIIIISALVFDYYKKPAENILEISGRIEADEIDLGFTMPGMIEKFDLEEGDRLNKGDFVARIKADRLIAKAEQYKIEIENTKNILASKKDKLISLKLSLEKLMIRKDMLIKDTDANITIAEHDLQSAAKKYNVEKAAYEKISFNLDKIRKDYGRISNLYKKGAVSKQKFDEILSLYNITKSELKAQKEMVSISKHNIEKARQNLKLAESKKDEIKAIDKEISSVKSNISAVNEEIKIAKNNINKAKQAYREVKETLSDATIHSPDNLTILEKYANTGEIVAAGQPILSSYNPADKYFRGYLPEPDLSRVKINDTGYLQVDGLPDRKFPAKLIYISDKAEFTPKEVQTKRERVKQVFMIKMKINDENNILKPGMPADCYLKIK